MINLESIKSTVINDGFDIRNAHQIQPILAGSSLVFIKFYDQSRAVEL